MPEAFLGDGLIFRESLSLSFTAGPLAQGAALARLNADNHQLLGAESSLDDVRVHESLKNESPALLHELQRMEFKLNIVLRLVAELTLRSHALPAIRAIQLTPRGLEWFGTEGPPIGAAGLLQIYINPALPQPLRIPATVEGERTQDHVRVAQLKFVGLSETVAELLAKFIFRHHRRLIAGTKSPAH